MTDISAILKLANYALLPRMSMGEFLRKKGIFPNEKYNDYQDYIEEKEREINTRAAAIAKGERDDNR